MQVSVYVFLYTSEKIAKNGFLSVYILIIRRMDRLFSDDESEDSNSSDLYTLKDDPNLDILRNCVNGGSEVWLL